MLPFGVFLWSWPRAGATLGCSEWVHGFLIAVCVLLIPVASLLVWQRLWVPGLRAVIHRLGCGVACDVFPNQGSNPHPLRWEHKRFLPGVLDHILLCPSARIRSRVSLPCRSRPSTGQTRPTRPGEGSLLDSVSWLQC